MERGNLLVVPVEEVQVPVMTPGELLKELLAGGIFVAGEYRGFKAEMVPWFDKEDGKRKSFASLRHAVEIAAPDGAVESVRVEERLPFGSQLSDIHVPYKRGSRMVFRLVGYSDIKGAKVATVAPGAGMILADGDAGSGSPASV